MSLRGPSRVPVFLVIRQPPAIIARHPGARVFGPLCTLDVVLYGHASDPWRSNGTGCKHLDDSATQMCSGRGFHQLADGQAKQYSRKGGAFQGLAAGGHVLAHLGRARLSLKQ